MLFAPGMIPSEVDSFEKLISWAAATMEFSAGGLTYKEREPNLAAGDSGIQKTIERTGFRAADGSYRVVYRTAFELQEDYGSNLYTMDFQAVKDLTSAAPNVNYLNASYNP